MIIVIVEALLRGVSDGMDILTMSLGGAAGWTEGTSTVVSSRISAQGKIVTIAAGNDVSTDHLLCCRMIAKLTYRAPLEHGTRPDLEMLLIQFQLLVWTSK